MSPPKLTQSVLLEVLVAEIERFKKTKESYGKILTQTSAHLDRLEELYRQPINVDIAAMKQEHLAKITQDFETRYEKFANLVADLPHADRNLSWFLGSFNLPGSMNMVQDVRPCLAHRLVALCLTQDFEDICAKTNQDPERVRDKADILVEREGFTYKLD